jgi:hypothetical protein
MRRIGILMLILFTCLVSAEWLQAQKPNLPPKANPHIPDISHMPALRQPPRIRLGRAQVSARQ